MNHSADNLEGELIRTFIAIEMPDSIKRKIAQLQEALRQTEAQQVSWTRPSNVHLTLKFLGAVPASLIERVRQAVERAAKGVAPFEVEVAGAGCFPSARNPRVLWVGISNVPDEMRALHSNLEDELAAEGFTRENRSFSPHLTIGRIRVPGRGASIAKRLIELGFESESFRATEVIVVRSDLKPSGSVYTPQAVVRFG